MSDEVVKYMHHGKEVSVRKDLKGKHREHCLCYICKKFDIEDRDRNCVLANIFYNLCKAFNVTTPIWECPEFEKIEE